MLNKLLEKNDSNVKISPVTSEDFSIYGKVIEGIDFSDMCAHSITTSHPDKTAYIRDLEILRDCPSFKEVEKQIYGGKRDLQAGLCFGMNSKMNGMEFHEGSEVIVAATDLVLILGRKEEISQNSWNSSMARCFYVPRQSAVELYGGTLHLAPCRVSGQPFCSIIILPDGTNLPLREKKEKSDPLLFMQNKWLICHEESPAVKRGAFAGIKGKNIQIKTV